MAQKANKMLVDLEPLSQNEYFTAFGLDGRYFFGSPNGYAANKLPEEIVQRITSGEVKRVLFASFGSHEHVWFVAYEAVVGGSFYEIGEGVAPVLATLVARMSPTDRKVTASFLRIQFGADDSYVAWSRIVWRAHKIQAPLQRYLQDVSEKYCYRPEKGMFISDSPINIAYHPNGSFFVIGFEKKLTVRQPEHMYYVYNVTCSALNLGLQQLCRHGHSSVFYPYGLVYAAIDPFSNDAEKFAFIKAQRAGGEADFVLCLNSQAPVSRVSGQYAAMEANLAHREFRWAVAVRSGRPHPTDTWELRLKKDNLIKVIEDRGKGWFTAQSLDDRFGYVYKTWIDFDVGSHISSTAAFVHFQKEVAKLFVPGSARSFPDLKQYVRVCKDRDCKRLKKDDSETGVCVHELEGLYRGSDGYSYALLKEERNKWHPDKFARFCHPDHREELKKKAEGMFVMITMLMELMDKGE